MKIYLSSTADELFYVDGERSVSFELEETTEFDDYADGIRERKGYIPFFDDRKEYWADGWYEFYLHVDPKEKKLIDIAFVVQGNDADEEICPDNGTIYGLGDYVDLSGVMEQLNAELKKKHTNLDVITKEVEEEYA